MEKLKIVLDRINAQYGLDVSFVRRVEYGYLTNNYILKCGDTRYFLKQYRYKEIDRIREVHKVKQFFSDGGIPVILPIKDKEGKSFFSCEGFYYSLFPFIKGKIIEREDLYNVPLASMAETLAKTHLLSKNGSPFTVSKKLKILDTEGFLEKTDFLLKIIEEKAIKDSYDVMAEENLRLKRKLVKQNDLNQEDLGLVNDHLIHGDYHTLNTFFDEHDKVQYIFDFEKTKLAPRVFELIRAVMFDCFNGNYHDKESFEKASLYISKYHSVYPLEKGEIEKGMRYMYLNRIHNLWGESEHYLKNNSKVDGFLPKRLESNKYLSKNLDEFISILENAAL
ncbi:hypothetical protein C4544_00320 [candidate division WS5 bacterium]|uniref:Aminoglycoside phosphotransferase domain-containing protein n=1 Tax=candidate division WS5 bacterium TaxID=2093353 RepID=A0A419DGL6_9BACT|nr:MAG: hypothetical protein C4544_00320 [candidate division WS5 bacterium]